jgi:hypothetical protein
VSFLAIGGERCLQLLRRWPEFLLQVCVLDVAGAVDASQAFSPGDQRRDWCPLRQLYRRDSSSARLNVKRTQGS